MNLRLRVNPITCAGHGICAVLLPERIHLDDWGYPIIDPAAIDGSLEGHARRAVAACPTLALTLAEEPSGEDRPKPSPPEALSRPPWPPAPRPAWGSARRES